MAKTTWSYPSLLVEPGVRRTGRSTREESAERGRGEGGEEEGGRSNRQGSKSDVAPRRDPVDPVDRVKHPGFGTGITTEVGQDGNLRSETGRRTRHRSESLTSP